MEEKEIVIDTEMIGNYLYKELTVRGYAPNEEEVEELADIFFDFLIDIQAIRENEDGETETE